MAENETGQEKTEEATPKRLEKAKEEGQIARSRELNTTFVLLAGVGGLMVFTPEIGQVLMDIMRFNFFIPREVAFDQQLMMTQFVSSVFTAIQVLVPLCALLLAAAIFGPVALGGWLFSAKALMPKLNRMDPIQGLKRMFSMNSLVELLKAMSKFVLITGFAVLILFFFQDDLMQLGASVVEVAIADGVYMLGWSVLAVSCAMIVIAAVDVPYQIYDHGKKLKMTLQEVKDELKDTEGKPEVKGRVRQLQRQMAQRRMMEAVPEADVVITNPDHFSVALKYDVNGSGAPVVLAKGVDHIALKIREIANAHDVMLLQAPPLERAIYYTTELDQEIPASLYLAVAQVLAYVFQLKAFEEGEGRKPKPLGDIELPLEAQFDSKGRPIYRA